YPKEKVEIIVVEGRQPSFQRNEAVKQASGDILYFLDSDSEADIDLFRLVARAFNSYKDKNVAVVGGPSEIMQSDSLLQRCFGYVLSSYFAVASVRCRYRSINRQPCLASERMLILANMAVKRQVFEEAGGLDTRLYPNEENEFLNRLAAKGYRFIYHPHAKVRRPHRTSLPKFIRQMFTYGRGRAEQLRVGPQFLSPIYLLPLLFAIYVISLPFAPFLLDLDWPLLVYLIPLALYVHAAAVTTLRILIDEREWKLIFVVPFLFPIVHVSYAVGLAWGMVKRMPQRASMAEHEQSRRSDLTVKIVQPFSDSDKAGG
ncbi:MAG: glycosyltransferase, partial [Chloroflexota bacterium]